MNLFESSNSGLNLDILSKIVFVVDNALGTWSSAMLDT
jgi:hypothetical protein